MYFVAEFSKSGKVATVISHHITRQGAERARTAVNGFAYQKKLRAHTAPAVGNRVPAAWLERACNIVG